MILKQRCRWNDFGIESQILSWDHDNFKGSFRVSDLNEDSEDAIIGRDLFDADDFIYAVRFGMDLRDCGYTDLLITEEEYEDE